jgi:predicted kinase
MSNDSPGPQFLLQLAGAPATGKSLLAAEIVKHRPAVIVNSDVVKSTMLDAGVEWKLAGPTAYQVLFALADDLLGQGYSVIVDSPSHYSYIPESGERTGRAHGCRYRFIELVCPDLDELARRFAQRTPRRSQMRGVDQGPAGAPENFSRAKRVGAHQWQTHGPEGGHMVLDTTGPVGNYLKQALDYIDQ